MLILLCTRYRHGLEHSYVRKLKGLAYMFFIFDLGGGGGTLIHYLYGYVPPKVMILKLPI